MQLSKKRIESIGLFEDQIGEIQDHDYLENLFIQADSLISKELWIPSPQLLVAILTILFMIHGCKSN